MKLKDYIDRFPEIDLQEIAKGMNISRATLWKAIQGNTMDLEVAVKIQSGTAGIVKCEDLLKTKNDQTNTKKQKQQQQNQGTLDTPIGLESSN